MMGDLNLLDILSWIFLMLGSFVCFSGAVGLHRFPDFFTRMHAAGVTDTLGAGLVLGGLMFQAGLTLITVKLFFIFIFLLLTGPASSHAMAKAAIHSGHKPIGDEYEIEVAPCEKDDAKTGGDVSKP